MNEYRHIFAHVNEASLRTQAVLSKDQFWDFYKFLSAIQYHFTDFQIIDGTFRAWSNGRQWIIEAGFSCFDLMSFAISNIKRFRKSLSRYDKKAKVSIRVTNDSIFLEDDSSEPLDLREKQAYVPYLDNKSVAFQELNSNWISNFDDLFYLETYLPKYVERIKKLSRHFNSPFVQFRHKKGNLYHGVIYIGNNFNGGVDSISETILKKSFRLPMKQNHHFAMDCLPFEICKEDLIVSYYLSQKDQKLYAYHNTKIGNITVNFYGRSVIVPD